MTTRDDLQRLEQALAALEGDSNADRKRRIDALNDLAWALADSNMKRATALAEEALVRATVQGAPYEVGQAYALRTQGYVNMRLGEYPLGLTQLLQARTLCEKLGLDNALADVLDGTGGIYAQIGEYPEALELFEQQLKVAERIHDRRRIANAKNNLVFIYRANGQIDLCLETLLELRDTAVAIGYPRMEAIARLNMAVVYLDLGEYEVALAEIGHALDVTHREGFEWFETFALLLIGGVFVGKGEADKAIAFFKEALVLSRVVASAVTESLVLLRLGRTYWGLRQADKAVETLHACLHTAEAIDDRTQQYEAHLTLSEISEQAGDLSQALHHFKQYQSIKERVDESRSDQRLKVFQVIHDTENAHREAEILSLRTVELERQVQERTAEIQEMVDQLEQRVADRSRELAALYDMTILFAEAASLREMLEPALRSICNSVGAGAIAVHVVSAGDRVLQLSAALGIDEPEQMQSVTLTRELEGWLKLAEAPLMIVGESEGYPFFPEALLAPDRRTYLGISLRSQKDASGLLSVYGQDDKPFDIRSVSLLIMIAEQLAVIIQNFRLQQQSKQMARAVERGRLARELHDSVAQRIYSLNLFARAGQDALAEGDLEGTALRLGQVEENALYSLREMRLLLYQLRPPALEGQSLAAAFEERFDMVERRLGTVAVVTASPLPDLTPDIEEEIYYIVSEALNNALKHSRASRVDLQLTYTPGRFLIRISDNGCGFDPGLEAVGLGLPNMRARVAQINGVLTIESVPGVGTTIDISL